MLGEKTRASGAAGGGARSTLFKFLHSVSCCNVFHHEAGKNIVNRQLFLDAYQTTTAEGAIAPQHRNLLTPARSGEIFSPCRRHPKKATYRAGI